MTSDQVAQAAKELPAAATLIERYGDDKKSDGAAAAHRLQDKFSAIKSPTDIPEQDRPAVRNDLNQVVAELKAATEARVFPRMTRSPPSRSTTR